jgi:hypothetical protein
MARVVGPIRLRGAELVATSDLLGDLVLAAAGGTTFGFPAIPGIGLTAELDSDGQVARIIVDQVGVFVPATSGAETAGVETAGAETAGAETAGAETAGVETA